LQVDFFSGTLLDFRFKDIVSIDAKGIFSDGLMA
jgi:hypothetical protein